MEIIFTLPVHFAEYVNNNGTEDKPQFGELSDVTVIIDKGLFKYDFEVKKRIRELSEQYNVSEDLISIKIIQSAIFNNGNIVPIY
jgi:hypothetical protein